MARTVLPFVGAAVGFWIGGPTGAQIGFAAGSIVGNALDPVKNFGPKIGETGAQTSSEGAPRGIVYGTAPVTGNVIYSGPLIHRDVETEQEGKGGGPVTVQDHVYRTFAIRVCEGPIGGYLRVWEDDKLVYDVRPGSAMLAESALWAQQVIFYNGDEAQLPDVYLQAVFGISEVPAHRGTAYAVFVEKDLTNRQGAISQYRFEVAGAASLDVTLAPLIVYPWINSLDPLNPDNEHTFQYVGFENQPGSPQHGGGGAPARTVLADAIADMVNGWNADPLVVSAPYLSTGAMGIVAWAANGQWYPLGAVASEQENVRLQYNEAPVSSWSSVITVPDSGIPDISLSGGIWGAQSPKNGVWYRDAGHAGGTQWADPARRYSTSTYTNAFSGGLEVFNSYDGYINVIRVPTAPIGYTKVAGTAKQLAVVEYSGTTHILIQNGLGPILLPGDPNYDNATFWADARSAAITAGTLDPAATSPVVVSEYAVGYSTLLGEPVPLGGIVADIHTRCQVPDDQFDVSELDDLVTGLVLAGDYTGADAVNTLRTPYFFDKSEYDKKLWYPKRGAPVVATLTIDDLVEEPDTSKREQAVEYPRKFHLFYQHAASGYAVVKATSARSSPDARVVGEATVQVPVVFNEDQAAQTVHKLHKVAYAEAEGEVSLSVPESLLRIVPSNNLGLALRGRVNRLRLVKAEHAEGVLTWTFRHDRQSAYTSNVTGVPVPDPTPPPSTIVGTTRFAFLDISSRLDSEDDLHYLVAVVGALPAWHGAAVQRSLDAGANYTLAATIAFPSVMGELQNDVPDASEFYTDTTNTVQVQLYKSTQTIEAITDAQFLSEGGAFALENADGTWEVMQYRDVHEDSNGIFTLSHLHRGQLNSGTAAHVAGARFVMLNRPQHVTAESAWIGQNLTHRAVSFGQSPEVATEYTNSYVGRSQLEWPVASLALHRSGSNVVTGTWNPRHRFGTDDAPVASINFQGYRVTIVGSSTVTFDTAVPTFSYDASALGGSVTVSVSSLNRITGPGPATSGVI